MQLILWRHAEAEDEAASDLERPLTERGIKQAARMSAWLHAQCGELDGWRVIVSPALRTRQTATALSCKFEVVDSIVTDVPPDNIFAAAGWPNAPKNVIVVGHQPTLGMVCARLLNDADGYVAVKKGAMWWFETRQRDGMMQTVLRTMVTPESVQAASK